MPFSLSDLTFIDDAFDSLLGGLDDLFSNKEERQKAQNELEKIKRKVKGQTLAHLEKTAKIAAEDRKQARSIQERALSKAWWVMPMIALFSFLGFFGILFTLTFFEVSAAKQPLYILLGALTTVVTQIAQFFFGSSQGSKNKDVRLSRAIEKIGAEPTGGSEAGQSSPDSSPQVEVPDPDVPKKIDSVSSRGEAPRDTSDTTRRVDPAPPERVGW